MSTTAKRNVISHDPLEEFTQQNSIASEDEIANVPSICTEKNVNMKEKTDLGKQNLSNEISLGEELTIQEVTDMKEKLATAFDSGSKILLKSDELTRVDGAGIQLLCAFFKEASIKQVEIAWTRENDLLKNAAKQLGMSNLLAL